MVLLYVFIRDFVGMGNKNNAYNIENI